MTSPLGGGSLWYTRGAKIGQITTSGQIQEYSVSGFGGASADASGITDGPDGNMWFTSDNAIGKVTPTGQITEFKLTVIAFAGSNLTDSTIASADGSLWFPYGIGAGNLGIAKFTTTGQLTTYPITSPLTGEGSQTAELYGITADSKGNLWFLEAYQSGSGNSEGLYVGEVAPSGTISQYPLSTTIGLLNSGGGIVYNDDGDLYITENNQIGRVIPSSSGGAPTFNQLSNPNAGSLNKSTDDITNGPDKNIWYTQQSSPAIVKLTTGLASSPTPTPTPTPTSPTPTPIITTPTPTATPTPAPTATPTPTPTASPAQSFAPPRINAVTEIRKRGRIRAIQLIFEPSDPATLFPSDPLNVADATNVSNYQVAALGRATRSHRIVVQPVTLASATYSHVTIAASATYGPFEEVTLTLSQPISQGERLQLTVISSTSAIEGVHGIPLDGDGAGRARRQLRRLAVLMRDGCGFVGFAPCNKLDSVREIAVQSGMKERPHDATRIKSHWVALSAHYSRGARRRETCCRDRRP